MLRISRHDPHGVSVCHNYNGPWIKCLLRNKKKLPDELALRAVYEEPLKLSAGKVADLKKLSVYLSPPNSLYYDQLCAVADEPSACEVDEDDNSSGGE